MDKIYNGYIIKVSPYEESHLICDLLTNEGIITFRKNYGLKGNSKNTSLISLFAHGEYQLSFKTGSRYNFLKEGKVCEINKSLYEDIYGLTILSFLSECIIKKYMEESYTFFDYIYHLIFNGEYEFKTIILAIIYKVMNYNGVNLFFDRCVFCGSTSSLKYISYNDGGLICNNCLERSTNAILKDEKFIDLCFKLKDIDYTNLNKFIFSGSKELIIELLDYLNEKAGLFFKSEKMIKDLL